MINGPAPMQNDYIADETFEGTINMGDGNIAHGATAEMAVQTIENVINRMRGNQVTVAQQTETEQGRSVVLQHTDVFTNDGFVDINKTQFVWARAFPSCYMPSYGRMQWVITNDITGFNGAREKKKFSLTIGYIIKYGGPMVFQQSTQHGQFVC